MARSKNILLDCMPLWVFKVLLVVATVIWGLSFVVMKDTVEVLPPAYLIGFRFIATSALLWVIFARRMRACVTRPYLRRGAIIGALLFLAYWTQTIGLAYTTPGKNAFLTATYCVIVPFLWWLVAHRVPTIFNLLAAILGVLGIGFVSVTGSGDGGSLLDGFVVGFGDVMTLVCALFYAVHIVYVAKCSKGFDVIALTVYQFVFGGICGLVVGFCSETLPSMPAITGDFLFNMFYLVVFASGIALLIQNVALKYVPPAQASLLLSLESVFGVLFSVLLYGEQVTLKLAVGFVLIFTAIVVSESFPLKGKINGGEK